MTGLDTNIFVRFLTKDEHEQFKNSYQLLSQRFATFSIAHSTLVELVWLLQKRYEFSKEQLIFLENYLHPR